MECKETVRPWTCQYCPKCYNGWCRIKAQMVDPQHPKCEYGKKLDR